MLGKLAGPLVLGVLIASAVFNLWASVRFFFSLRELYKLQAWVQYINSTQTAARSLVSDSVEYARQHPSLDPVLQRFMKAGTNPVPPQAEAPANPGR